MKTTTPTSSSSATRGRRKAHCKSTYGCYPCRQRRIKCSETIPSCTFCSKKNISCVYPPLPQHIVSSRVAALGAGLGSLVADSTPKLSTTTLETYPTSFSMEEMLLFHHFIVHAPPNSPIGNNDIWSSVIPQYSGEFEFLMHAILAYAGSEYDSRVLPRFHVSNLQHRTSAITGLSNVIHQPTTEYTSDVLLATCYLLATQSLYFKDGLYDFITMTRGCALLVDRMRVSNYSCRFRYLERRGAVDDYKIKKWNYQDQPQHFNEKYLLGMRESLLKLQDDAFMIESVRPFCTALHDVADALPNGPFEAMLACGKTWPAFIALSGEDFAAFCDRKNIWAMRVIAHWMAALLLLSPFEAVNRHQYRETRQKAFKQWLLQLIDAVHLAQREFESSPSNQDDTVKWDSVEWPQRVLDGWNSGTLYTTMM